MPRSQISGHDGSVTMPSVHNLDVASWSLTVAQRTKDTSIYNGSRFSQTRGGLLDGDVSIAGFAVYDATATSPGLVSLAVAGSTLTLTAVTGCTYSGTAVFLNGNITHAVADPAIPLTYSCRFTGTITETWDVTG